VLATPHALRRGTDVTSSTATAIVVCPRDKQGRTQTGCLTLRVACSFASQRTNRQTGGQMHVQAVCSRYSPFVADDGTSAVMLKPVQLNAAHPRPRMRSRLLTADNTLFNLRRRNAALYSRR